MLGSGLKAIDARRRASTTPASARPAQIGELLLTKFLLAVRGRLVPAADRRGRRGRARAPARRASSDAGEAVGRRLRLPAPAGHRHDGRGRRRRARRRDRPEARRAARAAGRWHRLVPRRLARSSSRIGAGGVLDAAQPAGDPALPRADAQRGEPRAGRLRRMCGNGDGQIFALIVMVVAACEVAVGLGLIVAMYRRRLPIDVDELRELQRMSTTTSAGWSSPSRSAGTIADRRCCSTRAARARPPGIIGTLAIARVVRLRDRRRCIEAAGPRRRTHRQVVSVGVGLRGHGRRRREAVDPDRPAVASSWRWSSPASRR